MLQDGYKKRFPELSSVSLSPIDFAKTVLRLGKAEDISKVDLRDVLSQRIVIILSTTTATTCGIPLSEATYQVCFDYATTILALDELKKKVSYMAITPFILCTVDADLYREPNEQDSSKCHCHHW